LQWAQFKDVCRKAFLIVRSNADLFINLLNMMLATGSRSPSKFCYLPSKGIPELKCRDDVKYLRDALCLELSEADAASRFMEEVGPL
jgi:phosphatidylinositol-4,5-bisphosphate 3-kinase